MDSGIETIYLDRAKNEFELTKTIFKISINKKLKTELELKEDITFFNNVISNAYYCIFYSTKAILKLKKINTSPPEEHRKTLEEFEKLVKSGELDVELLKIYKRIFIKAETLLAILRTEKKKRGVYTYKKLPEANKEPARESMNNAEIFLKNIIQLLKK